MDQKLSPTARDQQPEFVASLSLLTVLPPRGPFIHAHCFPPLCIGIATHKQVILGPTWRMGPAGPRISCTVQHDSEFHLEVSQKARLTQGVVAHVFPCLRVGWCTFNRSRLSVWFDHTARVITFACDFALQFAVYPTKTSERDFYSRNKISNFPERKKGMICALLQRKCWWQSFT